MAKNNPTKQNDSDIAVSVSGVSKYFPPTKGQGSLKQLFTSFFRSKDTVKEGGYWALKDVSFEVKKGEFFGIVGRNGSGKSTLLKMIAGVYSPTKGSLWVNGKLVPFIELGVGFNPELSGKDNVFLNGALLGFNRKEMLAMYDEIVDFAELRDHMDVKLKNYSSGMHVRLAFSIAVRAKAEILLIDEVLAVGDAAFQQKCFNYFEDLKKQRKTVIFVSHDMNAVRRFCNRAIYISEGVMTHEGTPESIAEEYIEKNISDAESSKVTVENGEIVSQSEQHKITISSEEAPNSSIILSINYVSSISEPLYIGISVQMDGMSVAEINTEKDLKLNKSGTIIYKLDKSFFNAGAYRLSGALFKKENRELLAIVKKTIGFTVGGHDIARGGPMKLPSTWQDISGE